MTMRFQKVWTLLGSRSIPSGCHNFTLSAQCRAHADAEDLDSPSCFYNILGSCHGRSPFCSPLVPPRFVNPLPPSPVLLQIAYPSTGSSGQQELYVYVNTQIQQGTTGDCTTGSHSPGTCDLSSALEYCKNSFSGTSLDVRKFVLLQLNLLVLFAFLNHVLCLELIFLCISAFQSYSLILSYLIFSLPKIFHRSGMFDGFAP